MEETKRELVEQLIKMLAPPEYVLPEMRRKAMRLRKDTIKQKIELFKSVGHNE